jgi:hypothetical protein
MWEDPIVAEVHRAREKLAADYNYDPEASFADVRKRPASLGSRLVRPNKPPAPTAGADRGGHSDSGGSTSCETAPVA